jgi:hypothetical protein
MSYSDYIYQLRDLLKLLGVQVIRLRHTNIFILQDYSICGGQCDYQKREISLNVPDAKDMVLTLAHEGGHWLSYLLFDADEDSAYDIETRELLAFNFGWYLLESIRAPIVSNDWIEFHQNEQEIIYQ